MIELILTVLFLIILFTISYSVFKDVLCPSFVVIGTLVIILCFYLAIFYIWPEQNYFITSVVLLLACMSFLAGSLLGRVKIKIKNRNNIYYKPNLKLPLNNMSLFILGAMIVISAILGGGYEYSISRIYREAGSFVQQLNDNNFVMDILLQILYGTTFIVEYSLITDIVYKEETAKRFTKALLIIPMNIVCVVCGIRFTLFIELMYILSVANIVYRLRNGKNNQRIISIAMKTIVGVVLVFIIAGFASSKISQGRKISVLLLKYLTVGIYGLTNFISTFKFNSETFGAISFNNLYRALNLLGFNFEYRYSSISKHYYVNETIGAANLYTAFMNLLTDFNYVGALVIMLLLGWMSTKVYCKILNGGCKNIKPWIIIYSCAFYLCIALWIEQNPINMLLSSSFIVRVFIIVLECKIIQYFNK